MAPLDPTKELTLFFPQWQGSYANDRAIENGAHAMYSALGPCRFADEVKITNETDDDISSPQDTQHTNAKPQIINAGVLASNAEDNSCLLELKGHRPQRIFTLGGDSSIELCPLGYLTRLYGSELGIVWIDARAGLNTPATSETGAFHDMVLRSLMHDRENESEKDIWPEFVEKMVQVPVRRDQIVLAGAREYDAAQLNFMFRPDDIIEEVRCVFFGRGWRPVRSGYPAGQVH